MDPEAMAVAQTLNGIAAGIGVVLGLLIDKRVATPQEVMTRLSEASDEAVKTEGGIHAAKMIEFFRMATAAQHGPLQGSS